MDLSRKRSMLSNVGDLFSNVKVLRPLKHYIPLRDNVFRTKVVKDVPSSKQHMNEEKKTYEI
jgi:hypothetical protein